jgi:hypothetical protein
VATADPPDNTATTATATGTSTVSKACQPPAGYPRTSGGSDGAGNTQDTGSLAANPDAGGSKGAAPSVPPTPTSPGNEASATDTKTDTKTTPAATTGGGGCSIGLGAVPNGTLAMLGLAATLALLARKREEN